MSAVPPPKGGLVGAFDHLAGRIVRALQQLFGFQYSRNAEHYIYTATVTSGATDAIGTQYNTAVRVTQEADFVCTRLNLNARIVSTGVLIGMSSANAGVGGDLPDAPALLQITDGSTDRQLHSAPVDAALAYGTIGGLPGIWARPRLFARNTTISLALTSLKLPTSAWVYRATFIGWKIYDAQALDLTSRV